MAKKAETEGKLITLGQLKKRWGVAGTPLYRLASVFAVADVERYEQTRTLTLRFNHLLAALERELEDKIDFATWARALTAAKKKIPQWGESS